MPSLNQQGKCDGGVSVSQVWCNRHPKPAHSQESIHNGAGVAGCQLRTCSEVLTVRSASDVLPLSEALRMHSAFEAWACQGDECLDYISMYSRKHHILNFHFSREFSTDWKRFIKCGSEPFSHFCLSVVRWTLRSTWCPFQERSNYSSELTVWFFPGCLWEGRPWLFIMKLSITPLLCVRVKCDEYSLSTQLCNSTLLSILDLQYNTSLLWVVISCTNRTTLLYKR